MFHKHDSTILGNKGKKSVDVPLKKSDRKSLLKEARALFNNDNDDNNSNNNNDTILHDVFMNGSLTMRKIQHAQLNKVTLYYKSPNKQQDGWPFLTTTQCIWMTVDSGHNIPLLHVPTVALLSVISISSVVTVASQVSKYTCRGAHVMRAGMQTISTTTSTTCDIVAVCVNGNAQPFGVGRLTKGTTPQTIGPGSQGVGVEIYTAYGDDFFQQQQHLSTEGRMNPIGGAAYDNGNYGNVGFLDGKIVTPIVAVNTEQEEESDGGGGIEESDVEALQTAVTELSVTEPPTQDESNEAAAVTDDSNVNPNDAILHQAVCQALVNIKDSQLPMTSTNFYAQHVKPACSAQDLQIKQTSWKKINTYLQVQMENKLLTCKPHNTDPMGYLTAINRKHQDLHGIKKDALQHCSSQTTKLAVVNLYIVPHYFVKLLCLDENAVKAIHAKSLARRGTGMLTTPEARAILNDYITDNKLLLATSNQVVQLDAALTNALFKNKRSNAPEQLSRKELSKVWMCKMEPAYALVQMPGNDVTKLGRGLPPKISIDVSTRLGRKNKYITRVRGLEAYDIFPEVFARNVSKRFACASTVETDPQGRAALKKGCVELDFQGHLVEELCALLVGDEKLSSHGGAKDSDYCLPKSAIDVVLKKNVPAKKPKKR